MLIPESHLRTFINPKLSTEQLAELLTMAGLEVEQIQCLAPNFSKVVVAQIATVMQHPHADRLKVCRVNMGAAEPLTIVCGAPNAAPGIKVPCALVGAQLPPKASDKPFMITQTQLRGVESCGMLCGASELGLIEDKEDQGLMILPENAPIGHNLRTYLDLDDAIFSIKLTPNRGDCLSFLGIAREIAALTATTVQMPKITAPAVTLNETIAVNIEAPEACPHFYTRILRGVNAQAPTPDWMVKCLQRCGMRTISILVDISNYLMLALGQPMHIYDADALDAPLTVRFAAPQESITLLNEQTLVADESLLLIADCQGPIGLAGIMGSNASKAQLHSKNIVLEAAYFVPEALAGQARRLNLNSEAAYRFERGVDPLCAPQAMERASELIIRYCGGAAGPVTPGIISKPKTSQTLTQPATPPEILLRMPRVQKILGIAVSRSEARAILTRLGFAVLDAANQPDALKAYAPSWRFDCHIEEDLIEEIARIKGFDTIPACLPKMPNPGVALPEAQRSAHQLRHLLASQDYQETIHFSFVDRQLECDLAGNSQPILLKNPIAQNLNALRSSLIGSLINTLCYQLNRQLNRVRIFEISRVFRRDPRQLESLTDIGGIAQPLMVAACAFGPAYPSQWSVPTRTVDFFDVKGDLEALIAPTLRNKIRFTQAEHPAFHPGFCAQIIFQNKVVGFIGALHPRWMQKYAFAQAPILFEIQAEILIKSALPQAQALNKLPVVYRDIALFFPKALPVNEILDKISALRRKQPNCRIIQNIHLFDVFQKFDPKTATSAQKSLAFRLTLQGEKETLRDLQIETALHYLIEMLKKECGATLRD